MNKGFNDFSKQAKLEFMSMQQDLFLAKKLRNKSFLFVITYHIYVPFSSPV